MSYVSMVWEASTEAGNGEELGKREKLDLVLEL